MAGDWIKMRADLSTSPKVVRIASALRADRFRVIGGLHAVWSLFDAHSADGVLDGYTLETLDEMIGFPGIAAAMESVGWLSSDGDSLSVPRFDEHNGKSAKRRATETERKRNARNTSAEMSARDADKMRSREEKSREEEKKNTMSGKPDVAGELLDYLNQKAGKHFRHVPASLDPIRARLKQSTPEQIRSVIDDRVRAWGADETMGKYLRPETLFRASKFEGYLGNIGEPATNGAEWEGV